MARRVQYGIASLLLFAAACGGKSEKPSDTVTLTGIAPADIKSNYDGDVILSGRNFNYASEVLIDGNLAATYPGVTVTIVDDATIRLHIAYAGAGHELSPGDRDIAVRVGLNRSETLPLHVRPILTTMEHVRTLPGTMTTSAGEISLWVRPFAQGVQVRPGHELAGPSGLPATAFRLENVRFTQTTSATPALATGGILGVEFDQVNDTYPAAVSLVIDQSGSMLNADPTDERVTQTQAFVDRLGATDQAKVIRFNANTVADVIDFTSDKVALKDALETLRTGENGNTPLWNASFKGVNDVAALVLENASKALIVLTDGIDNASTATPTDIIDAARNADVPAFVIGLGDPNDPNSLDRAALQDIADQTGGIFFFAQDATSLESIFHALNEVLASSYRIDGTYTLATPLPSAGTYTVEADVVTAVDGEEVRVSIPPFTASIVD